MQVSGMPGSIALPARAEVTGQNIWHWSWLRLPKNPRPTNPSSVSDKTDSTKKSQPIAGPAAEVDATEPSRISTRQAGLTTPPQIPGALAAEPAQGQGKLQAHMQSTLQ